MTIAPAVTPLAEAAYARLDGISGLATYFGAPPDDADVPTIPGSTLAAPFATFYPGAGRAGDLDGSGFPVNLAGDLGALGWPFRIIVAAGPLTSCLWAIDQVRAAFTYGAALVVTGLGLGQILEDADPGPVQREPVGAPTRFYLPMYFRLNATRGD